VQLLPISQSPLIVDCQPLAGTELSAGDRVQIELVEPDGAWLPIVLGAYGTPTIGMITGTLAGYWGALALHMPQLTEAASLAGFFLGLTGGLIAWSRAEKSTYLRIAMDKQPRLHKVIQER